MKRFLGFAAVALVITCLTACVDDDILEPIVPEDIPEAPEIPETPYEAEVVFQYDGIIPKNIQNLLSPLTMLTISFH